MQARLGASWPCPGWTTGPWASCAGAATSCTLSWRRPWVVILATGGSPPQLSAWARGALQVGLQLVTGMRLLSLRQRAVSQSSPQACSSGMTATRFLSQASDSLARYCQIGWMGMCEAPRYSCAELAACVRCRDLYAGFVPCLCSRHASPEASLSMQLMSGEDETAQVSQLRASRAAYLALHTLFRNAWRRCTRTGSPWP